MPNNRRIIALFALINFFTSQTGWTEIPASEKALASQITVQMDLAEASLPVEMGEIKDLFKGRSDKTVILIQDAHAIPAAQKKIHQLIHYFQEKYAVETVALEGAASSLDTQIFRSFPDKSVLQKTFDEYVENGEVPGSVTAAVFGGQEGTYHGIEDWKLYEEGLGYYLMAIEKEAGLLEKHELMEKALAAEKKSAYSSALLKVDRLEKAFFGNDKHLLQLLTGLAEFKEPESGSALATLLEEGRNIGRHQAALDSEIKESARILKNHLNSLPASPANSRKLAVFHEKFQEFQTSRITPQDFAHFLNELAFEEKYTLEISGELAGVIENQKRMKDIEGTRLFRDLEQYIASVKEALFRNEKERMLDLESRRLTILGRLIRLELHQEDWHELKSSISESEREFSPEELKAHRLFYENARKREEAMFAGLTQLLSKKVAQSSILVAGGFHAEGLTRMFKENDISYLVVTPKISSIPENSLYRQHMRGDVSWKDYLEVENGKINLNKAFVRAVRDRLLEKGTGDMKQGSKNVPIINDRLLPVTRNSSQLLKRWRDQILRDIAGQKRLSDAHKYTSYIDEAASDTYRNVINEQLAKIDQFVNGLIKLESAGQLNQQSILKLLEPATIPGALDGADVLSGDRLNVEVQLPEIGRVKLWKKSSSSKKAGKRSELRSVDKDVEEYFGKNLLSRVIDSSLKVKWAGGGDHRDLAAAALIYGRLSGADKQKLYVKFKSEAEAGNPGAIIALGIAFPFLDSGQKKEILTFLKLQTETNALRHWAIEALTLGYPFLNETEKETARGLIQTYGYLLNVGRIYPFIKNAQEKQSVLQQLIKRAEEGWADEIEVLGGIYYALTDEEKQTVFQLLVKLNNNPPNQNFEWLIAIGRAYPALNDEQKAMVYSLLKNQAETGGYIAEEAALEGLAHAYEFLDEKQKSEVFSLLKDKFEAASSQKHKERPIIHAFAVMVSKLQVTFPEVELPVEKAKQKPASASPAQPVYSFPSLFGELKTDFLKEFLPVDNEEIIKDFEEKYYPMIKSQTMQPGGDMRSLAAAYSALPPKEQDLVYQILMNKFKVPETRAMAIWSLGFIYEFVDESRQGEIYSILTAAASAGVKSSYAALGKIYATLTPDQKETVYSLLKKYGEKYLGSPMLMSFSLEGLGAAYAALWTEQKEEVYALLIKEAGDGNLGALNGLGMAYGALTDEQKSEAYALMKAHASAPAILDEGIMSDLAGLPYAYSHLTEEQQQEIYQLFQSELEKSNPAAYLALGIIYSSFSLFFKKADMYKAIQAKADAGDPAALMAMALIYSHVKNPYLKYLPKFKTLLEQKVEKVIFPSQKIAPVPFDLNPSQAEAVAKLLHQIHVIKEFETTYLKQIMHHAYVGDPGALKGLGYVYPFAAQHTDEILGLLLLNPDQNPIRYEALGYLYGGLTQAEQAAVYKSLTKAIQTGNNFAAYAVAHAYPFLSDAQKTKVIFLLEAGQVLTTAALRTAALALIYRSAPNKKKIDEIYDKLLMTNNYLGLAHLYPALSEVQQKHVLEILMMTEKQSTLYLGLGLIFEALPKDKKELVFNHLMTQLKNGNGMALEGLAHAYPHLDLEQQKEIYQLAVDHAKKEDDSAEHAFYALSVIYSKVKAGLSIFKMGPSSPSIEDLIKSPPGDKPLPGSNIPAASFSDPLPYVYPPSLTGQSSGAEPIKMSDIFYNDISPQASSSAAKPGSYIHNAQEIINDFEGSVLQLPFMKIDFKPDNQPLLTYAWALAFPYLDDDQRNKMLAWLKVDAEHFGYSHSLIALGMIYPHLPSEKTQEILSLLMNEAKKPEAGSALEALGIIYSKAWLEDDDPEGLVAEILTDAEKDEIYALLKQKAEEGNEKALWGLAYAYPHLAPEQKGFVLDLLKSKAGTAADPKSIAAALPYIFSSLPSDDKALKGEIYTLSAAARKKFGGVAHWSFGIVLKAQMLSWLATTPAKDKQLFAKVYLSELYGKHQGDDPNVLITVAHVYPFLTPSQQAETYLEWKNKIKNGDEHAIYAMAIIYAEAKKMIGNIEAAMDEQKTFSEDPSHDYSELGPLEFENGITDIQLSEGPIDTEGQPGSLPEGKQGPDLLDMPLFPHSLKPLNPSMSAPGEENTVSKYTVSEYDPVRQDFYPVTYEITEPAGAIPAPNPQIQNAMQKFDQFETLNFDVLSLLNKQNKTIGDLNQLLYLMEQMVKVYLDLFKKQPVSIPLENIAASPSDLEGGRTVAKVFLRIKDDLNRKLKEMQPGQTAAAPLNDAIEASIQGFDGNKTAQLISTPAENYSSSQADDVSFAELINIVHQKGVRNLSSLISQIHGGQKKINIKILKDLSKDKSKKSKPSGPYMVEKPQEMRLGMSYFDARSNPDQKTPLPARYVAEAFSKGQMIHHNEHYFPPSQALVLSDEKRAIIGMHLGAHSARIQLALMPVQEGGRVAVNYTDSGPTYAPGSTIRIEALAEAFRRVGFKVNHSGYSLDAYFDKDSGASSIDELPEKLEFAVQVLSGTKDLDLFINHGPIRHDPQAVQKLANHYVTNGYLIRPGPNENLPNEPVMLETAKGQIEEEAKILGIRFELRMGQRQLDQLSKRKQLLMDRGAITLGPGGKIERNPEYEQASKNSPISQFLKQLDGASPEKITSFRQIALIAKTVEGFAQRRVIGAVGKYHVEQLVLPLLGDQITFYVLKNPKDNSFHLAYAVLGEFPFNYPRYDRFRGIKLEHNFLALKDLEAIMVPQNFGTSQALKDWAFSVFRALKEVEEMPDRRPRFAFYLLETNFLDKAIPPFSLESLQSAAAHRQNVSASSYGGISINQGKTMGLAVLNHPDKTGEDLTNGILIAAYTEPPDDPKIQNANGVVVTTGGVLSHAAIRSREHKKPALILNGAEVTAEGLKFKRFKGVEQKNEAVINGQPVYYYELSDYGEEEQIVKDGDLVYVDAESGVFYVLAAKDDQASIQAFLRYESWKKSGGDLEGILKYIQNDNLLRALLDELLYHSLVPPAELEVILKNISRDAKKKNIMLDFLKEQARNSIEAFQKSFRQFQETMASTRDLEQVYLMVDDLMSQATRLERAIQLANGNWTEAYTLEDLHGAVESIILSAKLWLSTYQLALADQVQRFRMDPVNGLLSLLRISAELSLAGLSMETVAPRLAARTQELQGQREGEISARVGRGILWKKDLKDRFARPLAGGKGANSAEIVYALDFLKKMGIIPDSIVAPEGFAIQPEEYRLWDQNGRPEDLDTDLKKQLAFGYRDLVAKQIESILSFLQLDPRTPDVFKKSLQDLLNTSKSLARLEEPIAIDMVIKTLRLAIFAMLENKGAEDISKSLKNRLQVFGAVAVRSSGLREDSAEEAMAGMRETKLNVTGVEDIYRAVIEVWKSGAEGVLIDEMINPKVSGVAFSADPVTKRTDRIRINAAFGLAKGLVDQKHGVSDPDSYLVAKPNEEGKSFQILSSHIGSKAQLVILDLGAGGTKLVAIDDESVKMQDKQSSMALDEGQIERTAQTVAGLAQFFGFQGDMEFSIDSDDRLVVLQFRHVTTIRESIERGKAALRSETREKPFAKISRSEARQVAGQTAAHILSRQRLSRRGLSKLTLSLETYAVAFGAVRFGGMVRSEAREQLSTLADQSTQRRIENIRTPEEQEAASLRILGVLEKAFNLADHSAAVAVNARGSESIVEEAFRSIGNRSRLFLLLGGETNLSIEGISKRSVGKLSRLSARAFWGEGVMVHNDKYIPTIQMGEDAEDLSGNKDLLPIESIQPAENAFGAFAPVIDATSRILIAALTGSYIKNIEDLRQPESRQRLVAALLKSHPELLQEIPNIIEIIQFNGRTLSINQTMLAVVADYLAHTEVSKSA